MTEGEGNNGQDFRSNTPPRRWATQDSGTKNFQGHPVREGTVAQTLAFRKRLTDGKPAADATPPLRRPGTRKS